MICQICGPRSKVRRLDFGLRPIMSRYGHDEREMEPRYPLVMAQCDQCGLVQLVDPVPGDVLLRESLQSPNKEPEGHLDRLAAAIGALVQDAPQSVLGLSYKDRSTLDRLENMGFPTVVQIDALKHLGLDLPYPSIAALQGRLDDNRVKDIKTALGSFRVVVARHILEHSHQAPRFLSALKQLLRPDGLLVLEIPDSTIHFKALDYTCPWEEHRLYFSETTFRLLLDRSGLEPVWADRTEYPTETCLTVIARLAALRPDRTVRRDDRDAERACFDRFSSGIDQVRSLVQRKIQGLKTEGPLSIFGAGHNTASYVNLLELEPFIDLVLDDDPNKKGRLLPGARLPILGTERLEADRVGFCLLSVGHETEHRLIHQHPWFKANPARLASIFPTSPFAWLPSRNGD